MMRHARHRNRLTLVHLARGAYQAEQFARTHGVVEEQFEEVPDAIKEQPLRMHELSLDVMRHHRGEPLGARQPGH